MESKTFTFQDGNSVTVRNENGFGLCSCEGGRAIKAYFNTPWFGWGRIVPFADVCAYFENAVKNA